MTFFEMFYQVIMFLGIGGLVTGVGGLIGYYIGLKLNDGCVGTGCGDPWVLAVLGFIPGIIYWLYEKLEEHQKKEEENRKWRESPDYKELQRLLDQQKERDK